MLVQVIQRQSLVPIDDTTVDQLVHAFISAEELCYDEVSIHFIDTKTMCAMHEEFFDDPSPTDCISFPMDSPDGEELGYKIMGDVFVCPETAAEYVKEHGGNLYEEITLYTIHGLLHLIGHDDLEDEEQTAMRAAETFHLEHIRTKGLWLRG